MSTEGCKFFTAAQSSPSWFEIDSSQLIRETGNEEKAAKELVKRIRRGQIKFPFKRDFIMDPFELFNSIKTIQPVIRSNVQYKLHSYFSQRNLYLPPRFRGVTATVTAAPNSYLTTDVLTDYFIEKQRLSVHRYDTPLSIMEKWEDNEELYKLMLKVVRQKRITPYTICDAIYRGFDNPEAKLFRMTWAKALIELVLGADVAGKKWLDISAGWGDRLLTAMALDIDYVGFDPNTELRDGHKEMIRLFGDPKRHRVIYEPFETAKIPDGPYDFVLTSPPYFTIEEYVPGQAGQSIVSYPDFNQWMVWFLFASVMKAWAELKVGGHLIMYLGDGKSVRICEALNIFIEDYLAGASWEGIIGLVGDSGYARPVWVWQKLNPGDEVVRWNPKVERSIEADYPGLMRELVRYNAHLLAPNFVAREKAVEKLVEQIKTSRPKINNKMILSVVSDPVLLSSIIEEHGFEKSLKWSLDIIDLLN